MKRQRFPLPTHPLTRLFEPAVDSVTTSLGCASVTSYRGTVRLFLTYLGAQYSDVRSLEQLHRDPHILGWLALLRSQHPPRATITRANYVIYLRRLLEELAWTQHLPDLAHLLGRDDVPRKEHHLPRPLTPEQDALVRQELLRRDDLLSNALLLMRHTGCASVHSRDSHHHSSVTVHRLCDEFMVEVTGASKPAYSEQRDRTLCKPSGVTYPEAVYTIGVACCPVTTSDRTAFPATRQGSAWNRNGPRGNLLPAVVQISAIRLHPNSLCTAEGRGECHRGIQGQALSRSCNGRSRQSGDAAEHARPF